MDSEIMILTEDESSQVSPQSTITNQTSEVHFKFRRKTQAQWDASTEVPLEGEPCFAYDTYRFKIGDGVKMWSSLPYAITSVDDGELT